MGRADSASSSNLPIKARRVLEEVLVPVQIVAAPPATVTQRTCLELFGLSKNDYLRLAGAAFPVKAEGKLRIARYADVEGYLTSGATLRQRAIRALPPRPVPPSKVTAPGSLVNFDPAVALLKAGFRPQK